MAALVSDKLSYIRMCTLRSALKLELIGMKRSRSPSAYKIIKDEFHITGNPKFVLEQFEQLIHKEKEKITERYRNVQPIK